MQLKNMGALAVLALAAIYQFTPTSDIAAQIQTQIASVQKTAMDIIGSIKNNNDISSLLKPFLDKIQRQESMVDILPNDDAQGKWFVDKDKK